MKHAALLAMLAAGALMGWYGSGRSSPAPGAERVRSPVQRVELVRTAEWNAGEIVLPRGPDGHFYADVSVDGASARMLVDTGASVVALAGDDADALGIAWAPKDVAPVAQGAGGAVHGVRVTLDRVQLGELEVRGVEAIVVPDLRISLLGQSFLGRVGRVEITGAEMVLGG
jgi:aspartyl protease family protein